MHILKSLKLLRGMQLSRKKRASLSELHQQITQTALANCQTRKLLENQV